MNFFRITACQGKNFYFLIIPASCAWFHLKGKAQLSVRLGTVSIMAYTLQQRVVYDVYSPASGCLLAVHVDSTIKIAASDVKAFLIKHCGSGIINRVNHYSWVKVFRYELFFLQFVKRR